MVFFLNKQIVNKKDEQNFTINWILFYSQIPDVSYFYFVEETLGETGNKMVFLNWDTIFFSSWTSNTYLSLRIVYSVL